MDIFIQNALDILLANFIFIHKFIFMSMRDLNFKYSSLQWKNFVRPKKYISFPCHAIVFKS